METSKDSKNSATPATSEKEALPTAKPEEFGGPKGLEPTRFGDWEVAGRCSDF